MSDQRKILGALCGAAIAAYRVSLAAPSPFGREFFDWVRHPVGGDLVIETSTIHNHDLDEKRIGYLVSDGPEPMYTDEEWLACAEEYENIRPTERIYRIRLLTDDSEVRWENADFVRVATLDSVVRYL